MRVELLTWQEREFVALSCEGSSETTAAEQLTAILARFSGKLAEFDLALDHVVRTRLWARDRESRDQASGARARILAGKARCAGSSYIAPEHFDSPARVGLDLLALRPARAGTEKTLKEYEPPITPLRYLIYDGLVFLSGVTATSGGLQEQMRDIVPRITDSLASAGSSWTHAVKISCFLQRAEKPEAVKDFLRAHIAAPIAPLRIGFVDGFSSPGKLVEVEVTARL